MSVETSFRALLAGYAPLTSLVGTRIALNAVPEGGAAPVVVFSTTHDRTFGLDRVLAVDRCTIEVQCWAETAAGADAVADAVIAAVATASATAGASVQARSTTFDPDLGLDATVLIVEWWVT